MTIVYLNGNYLPIEKACVSVMDRGFLLGDGVYEVVPVFNGHLFRFDEHIERLKTSLALIHLNFDTKDLLTIAQEVITRNKAPHQSLYIQITRGMDPNPVRKHAFPEQDQPTVYVSSAPLVANDKAQLQQGCKAITLPDIRWHSCHIKAVTLLANVLASQVAKQAEAADVILIRDTYAMEGASSNLFMVKKGVLITTPLSELILGGITRNLTLDLAEQLGIPCEQRYIQEIELKHADELWFTSSTKDILPILQLNEHQIGEGKPGPVWHQVADHYLKFRQDLMQSN